MIDYDNLIPVKSFEMIQWLAKMKRSIAIRTCNPKTIPAACFLNMTVNTVQAMMDRNMLFVYWKTNTKREEEKK